jgi:hypothetical protein
VQPKTLNLVGHAIGLEDVRQLVRAAKCPDEQIHYRVMDLYPWVASGFNSFEFPNSEFVDRSQ